MITLNFYIVFHNGISLVASRVDCGFKSTLTKETLELRIANLKKEGYDFQAESLALAEMNRQLKLRTNNDSPG